MLTIRRSGHSGQQRVPDDDVVARLADCHARIRAHCAEARALAALAPERVDPRAVVSAHSLRAYFGVALPLHAQDEDRSIAPRLGPEAAALTRELDAQHARIEQLTERLDHDWRARAEGTEWRQWTLQRQDTEALVLLLDAHLALEEAELFPRVSALPSAERRVIVGEMMARRAR